MKLQTVALSLAVAAAGLVGGQAFAQDRDVTITHDTPNGGVVTKHIRRDDDGVVHRTVRVQHPDGSTTVRHMTRSTRTVVVPQRTVIVRRHEEPRRTVIVHRSDEPRHVVVMNEHHRAPRQVTIIRDPS